MKKNKTMSLNIFILIAAWIVGGGSFYATDLQKQKEVPLLQQQMKESKTPEIPSLFNDNQNLNNNSTSNLFLLALKTAPSQDEYKIISYNAKNGEQKTLGIIKTNFFNQTFRFSNGKVFFGTDKGELGSLDIISHQQDVIKISDILPLQDIYEYSYDNSMNDFYNNSLSNFFISGNKIFYLRNLCGENEKCILGVYDLSTGKNEILIENLHEKISTRGPSGIYLSGFDSERNILHLSQMFGDAGAIVGSIYEINLYSKEVTEKGHAGYRVCDYQDTECAESQKLTKEKFDALFPESLMECGGINISSVREKSEFINSHFISCIE